MNTKTRLAVGVCALGLLLALGGRMDEITAWEHLWSRPDLLGWALIGAFTLYVLNRLHDRQPFSLFSVLNIDVGRRGKAMTILADMVLSSLLGAMVVFAFVAPDTAEQAIAAGLGMTGILSATSRAGDA